MRAFFWRKIALASNLLLGGGKHAGQMVVETDQEAQKEYVAICYLSGADFFSFPVGCCIGSQMAGGCFESPANSERKLLVSYSLYRNRLTIFFEGYQYQLGDFQVKAGRAVLAHSENLRGIVLEVEYVPVSSIEQTRILLQEFVELLQEVVAGQNMLGRFIHLEPNYTDYNLPDQYSWQHTALQYITLMVYFMSSTRS
ncbi:hypothetical protein R1flu_003709 [Riccia fluitans]|uniref:Mediator of RNA polymerase II transcription subunit 20 n=1 Tax=Riccia fluitans TaxID=41844 RepID=A0ABD1Y9R5_9MARC